MKTVCLIYLMLHLISALPTFSQNLHYLPLREFLPDEEVSDSSMIGYMFEKDIEYNPSKHYPDTIFMVTYNTKKMYLRKLYGSYRDTVWFTYLDSVRFMIKEGDSGLCDTLFNFHGIDTTDPSIVTEDDDEWVYVRKMIQKFRKPYLKVWISNYFSQYENPRLTRHNGPYYYTDGLNIPPENVYIIK